MFDTETTDDVPVVSNDAEPGTSETNVSLNDFVSEFGTELLDALHTANPPVFTGRAREERRRVLDALKRKLFPAQATAVHTVAELLINQGERAACIVGEMGCGKTIMGIAAASILHNEGFGRTLVLSPPHLVYKWRREIQATLPSARVWVLNGPDTLMKLLSLRESIQHTSNPPAVPEFYVLGRVRMRLGFHWRPAFQVQRTLTDSFARCPHCGAQVMDSDNEPAPLTKLQLEEVRRKCQRCSSPLWTLVRPQTQSADDQYRSVLASLKRIPTIGDATARHLIDRFGGQFLGSLLADNLYEFVNLMDSGGRLVFSDRQATRMERALASMEFGLGQGGFQPSEFIKRYLPRSTFDVMIADEAHEFKNWGTAQGQAMGVIASKVKKVILLTGTLMGGYADDLFFLLFRAMPQRMLEDGYRPNRHGSMTPAALAWMRDHGVLREIFTERVAAEHKTARGKKFCVRTVKAPGFGPRGILRFVIPYSVFVKLKDIGGDVLPPYTEEFREIHMGEQQAAAYQYLSTHLGAELRSALRNHDNCLLGVVLQVLLAWPDCCFRDEVVKHPRLKRVLASVPAIYGETDVMPKERELVELCRTEKSAGRKVLVYSIYSGTRDTLSRTKTKLEDAGLKTAVLRASVDASRREEWIAEQLDRHIDVVITNPELVKTGLDLLEFPTIVFCQSGYNVYTLQQAARRSWRIGQRQPVKVYYLGYSNTSQMTCLGLMARKIAVSQSTSGDAPESGVDCLNQEGDSIEVALARQLIA